MFTTLFIKKHTAELLSTIKLPTMPNQSIPEVNFVETHTESKWEYIHKNDLLVIWFTMRERERERHVERVITKFNNKRVLCDNDSTVERMSQFNVDGCTIF